jgi:hypothetical protein
VKNLLLVDGFVVGIMSSYLSPTFVQEDIEPVLIVGTESAVVIKDFH